MGTRMGNTRPRTWAPAQPHHCPHPWLFPWGQRDEDADRDQTHSSEVSRIYIYMYSSSTPPSGARQDCSLQPTPAPRPCHHHVPSAPGPLAVSPSRVWWGDTATVFLPQSPCVPQHHLPSICSTNCSPSSALAGERRWQGDGSATSERLEQGHSVLHLTGDTQGTVASFQSLHPQHRIEDDKAWEKAEGHHGIPDPSQPCRRGPGTHRPC